nr:TetR/AcrR family transcriptional regulator [Oscillospiraceae bacterium]
MSDREDLRVRRTKKALADAFMHMLGEKPLDEITINELCDVAGIRRATFYKHYSDKFDFLTSYIGELRGRFDRHFWKPESETITADYYVAYAKRLIVFITEHSAAIDNIYKSNMFPIVMSIIVDQNYKDTCDRLRKSVENGMELSASVEVTASMCAGGVATTVYNWLRDGKKISPDSLAEQVGAVVSAAISQK